MVAVLEYVIGTGRGDDIFSFFNKQYVQSVFAARVYIDKRFTVPARGDGDLEYRIFVIDLYIIENVLRV